MNYHAFFVGPAVVALALALNGCSGLAPRVESGFGEPPAWNSPQMMMMDTEIVSVDPQAANEPRG